MKEVLQCFAKGRILLLFLWMIANCPARAAYWESFGAPFEDNPPGTLIPPRHAEVIGYLTAYLVFTNIDYHDWFQFQNLWPGRSLTITFSTDTFGATELHYILERGGMEAFTTNGDSLGSLEISLFDRVATLTTTVPEDGMLRIHVALLEEGDGFYSVRLNQEALVPEPSVSGLVAAALVMALARRRTTEPRRMSRNQQG